MEKGFQIGEIARFFGLPASTLRYWDQCGILQTRQNEDNQYRTYTISDLMTISDVLFYKNLGLPLKQIRDMEKATPEEQRNVLNGKMEYLEARLEQIRQQKEKLRHHLAAMDMLEDLRRHPYAVTEIDTKCIVSFELMEKEKLRQYIEDPYRYVWIQSSEELSQEARGLSVDMPEAFPADQILWKKEGSTCVTFLLKEEIVPGFPNDLQVHLDHIHKQYKTGMVISRFLLCAREDGKLYDFYKTFVEISDRNI